MKHFTFKLFAVSVLLSYGLASRAQDIHYSQFANSALNLSPALTGMYQGDGRFYGHMRNQWWGVPVSYRTFSAAYDKRFLKKSGMHSPWSAGLLFNYDRAGDSRLTNANLSLNLSYMQRIAKGHFLTLGVSPGIAYRGFDLSDLTWDNNYNGTTNTLPSGEVFETQNRVFGDVGSGLNWHHQSQKNRTNFDVGAALFHVASGNTNFDNNVVRIPQRTSLYAMGVFQVGSRIDLMANAIRQVQGPHDETVYAGHIKYHISTDLARETAISFGVGNRTGDAWFPQVNFWYQGWQLGLSYDANTSRFRRASDRNGGPEISLIHVWRKAPKVEYCPLCPRYVAN